MAVRWDRLSPLDPRLLELLQKLDSETELALRVALNRLSWKCRSYRIIGSSSCARRLFATQAAWIACSGGPRSLSTSFEHSIRADRHGLSIGIERRIARRTTPRPPILRGTRHPSTRPT
jgi:hypothetical protein